MSAGHEPLRQPDSWRVAVCTTDLAVARRIRRSLVLDGHQVAGTCVGLLELIDDLALMEADLAVATVDPAQDTAHLALLRRQVPGVQLIAVVPTLRAAQSARLLAADVDGLVLETEIEHALAPTIASVAADQLCVPSSARSALAGPVFSHREKQVLKLLLTGLTNSEIAGRLYLSESTVKSHLSSSFRKLGVSSRGEVMRRARSADGALRLTLSADRDASEPRPVLA